MATDLYVCASCKHKNEYSWDGLNICLNCGSTKSNQFEEKATNPLLQVKTFVVTSFLVFAIGISMLWGAHSFEMLGLKAKTALGVVSTKELNRMVNLCYRLNNASCAKNALEKIRTYEPDNIEAIGQIGTILEKTKDYKAALVEFATYFSKGGTNVKYRMAYARALASLDMFNQAAKQFDMVIAADKYVFSDEASRFYVNMLMGQGDYYKATQVVAAIQRKGGKVGYLGEYVSRQVAKVNAANKAKQIDTSKDMYDLIISEEKTLTGEDADQAQKRVAETKVQ